jgi:hypothetical protein
MAATSRFRSIERLATKNQMTIATWATNVT